VEYDVTITQEDLNT